MNGSIEYNILTDFLPAGPKSAAELGKYMRILAKKALSQHSVGHDIRKSRLFSNVAAGVVLTSVFSGHQGAEVTFKSLETILQRWLAWFVHVEFAHWVPYWFAA